MKNPNNQITVNGLVASKTLEPLVELQIAGTGAQMSVAAARKLAADIVQMAARTEADAMIHMFFSAQGYPPGAHVALMMKFRKYRAALDGEQVEGTLSDPDRDNDPVQ